MARKKDVNWNLPEQVSWEGSTLAVLMDLRDELKRLNGVLSCPNFVGIPSTLRKIAAQTARRKRGMRPKLRRVS